ncbi:MAG TPA: SRPBCC family protein [Planctomycetota bacterium]|nr:SRPBCC family protein [Planctomycetota bacterium]
MRTIVEKSITANVPAATAYAQWTRPEEFPLFLEHVDFVHREDDRHFFWRTKLHGRTQEWMAEIVERIPKKRIAWRSTRGAQHAGVVTFHHLEQDKCRIMLQIGIEPEGVVERIGTALGIPAADIGDELRRFANHVEQQARKQHDGTS